MLQTFTGLQENMKLLLEYIFYSNMPIFFISFVRKYFLSQVLKVVIVYHIYFKGRDQNYKHILLSLTFSKIY